MSVKPYYRPELYSRQEGRRAQQEGHQLCTYVGLRLVSIWKHILIAISARSPDEIAPSALLLGAGAALSLQATIRYYTVASALARSPSHFIPARSIIAVTAFLACSFSTTMLYQQMTFERRPRCTESEVAKKS